MHLECVKLWCEMLMCSYLLLLEALVRMATGAMMRKRGLPMHAIAANTVREIGASLLIKFMLRIKNSAMMMQCE